MFALISKNLPINFWRVGTTWLNWKILKLKLVLVSLLVFIYYGNSSLTSPKLGYHVRPFKAKKDLDLQFKCMDSIMPSCFFVLVDVHMFSGYLWKDPYQMATFFVKAVCRSQIILLVRGNHHFYLDEINKNKNRIFAVQHQKFLLVEVIYHIPG